MDYGRMTDADRERLARYAANLRLYYGHLDGAAPDGRPLRLKHNLIRPIVDVAADWTVGPESGWQAIGDTPEETERLTQAAVDVWDRSGGHAAFARAVQTALVYGDLAAFARRTERGAAIVFPDPSVCLPSFAPDDCSVLTGLRIEYGLPDGGVRSEEIDPSAAAWLPNRAILGRSFGEGEAECVHELVIEYDWVRRKKTRIVDYYAKPTPVIEGVSGVADFGDLNTVLKLPRGARAYFLEWSGSQPDVEEHLAAIRQSICAVSQTPPIAFAEVDRTFSGQSGVALKVLFGPLEGKTRRRRAAWTAGLARVMAAALAIDGFSVDPSQVLPVWQSAAPSAESEELANVEALGRIGLSRRNRLRRLGYDEREIEENEAQLEEERRQAADLAIRTLVRGPEG